MSEVFSSKFWRCQHLKFDTLRPLDTFIGNKINKIFHHPQGWHYQFPEWTVHIKARNTSTKFIAISLFGMFAIVLVENMLAATLIFVTLEITRLYNHLMFITKIYFILVNIWMKSRIFQNGPNRGQTKFKMDPLLSF